MSRITQDEEGRVPRRPQSAGPKADVVVVDDQTIFREMLIEILEADHYLVRAQCSTGADGLLRATTLRPRLVILDVVLPDMHGLDVLRELRRKVPETRVLVVTAHERAHLVAEALELGAHGVVSKGAPLSELREALARVVDGRSYFCSVTSGLVREHATRPAARAALSARQRQILKLVASGMRTKEIAVELGLSPKTVSNHRMQIMTKLGLHDVASLTRYAFDLSLIESAGEGEAR